MICGCVSVIKQWLYLSYLPFCKGHRNSSPECLRRRCDWIYYQRVTVSEEVRVRKREGWENTRPSAQKKKVSMKLRNTCFFLTKMLFYVTQGAVKMEFGSVMNGLLWRQDVLLVCSAKFSIESGTSGYSFMKVKSIRAQLYGK